MPTLESFSKLFLDAYDRPARLYPALLVLAPIPILVVCLDGAANIVVTSVVSILIYCGAGYALTRFARNAGKQLQDALFKKWGGAPTTQLLRHRNSHFDAHTKAQYHDVLSKGLGKPLPTAQSEADDPVAADEMYIAATRWLIEQTKKDSKRFPLVFKENVAFGFHRNALGVRWYGAAVAFVCILITLVETGVLLFGPPYIAFDNFSAVGHAAVISLGVSIVLLVTWLFVLTESAARLAGLAYAERLLQSCGQLKSSTEAAPRARKTPAPKKKP